MADHLLSFVTGEEGTFVSIHVDLAGVELLIERLDGLRRQLLKDDCPHDHLFGYFEPEDLELTLTMLKDQPGEVNQVSHVKIYGWNEEWAKRHGLKP